MLALMLYRHYCCADWRARLARAAAGLAALFLALAAGAAPKPPVIFAAASTTAALSELAAIHERRAGVPLRLSFASSATLARQVLNGARPALFLSANREWMDALDGARLLAPGSRKELLGNRLVVIKQRGSDQSVSLADPDTLLAALGETPLVIGDPAHVPAGLYGREALRRLGIWERLEGRLAFAANARAVSMRVARGEAPLGITYASELSAESGLVAAAWFPEESHSPIRYELASVKPDGGAAARAFYEYLFSDEAQQVFLAHRFIPFQR
ncbi:MAG: molybdate ABC transporter substrate-binding protein [Gammaproteobacteria bacterium]|nr:molybdate ABC transporter substrate-binding protein [Gammaproteobacteria bacterium]